jgi:hypothetical protein
MSPCENSRDALPFGPVERHGRRIAREINPDGVRPRDVAPAGFLHRAIKREWKETLWNHSSCAEITPPRLGRPGSPGALMRVSVAGLDSMSAWPASWGAIGRC